MNFIAPLLLGLCLISPPPDLTTPGFKKIRQEVAIENPHDFEGWLIVAATHLGPSHVTVVEPGVPFTYSSKYPSRVYALPAGTPVPSSPDNRRIPRSEFDGFLSASPPVSHPSSVPTISPVARALTTIRIRSISGEGMVLTAVSTRTFDSAGRPVSWVYRWLAPGGIVVLGLVSLVWLRRRRRRRAQH